MYSLAFNQKEIRHKCVRKFCCLSWQTCKVSDTTQAVCLAVSVISALGSAFAVLESGKRSCWPQVPSRTARLPERLCFIHLIRTPRALREALITTHTMSFHASNGSISPNIKLFLWFFFPLWRFSSYFRHVPGCRLSFLSLPVLHSDGRGWLDFGGEDLPEPPLQLLHVGRFGSGQVESSSSLLPIPSSQCPDHLQDRRQRDLPKCNHIWEQVSFAAI